MTSTVSRGSDIEVNRRGRRRWRAGATFAWLIAGPLAVGAAFSFAREVAPPAYDLIIEHGRVVDGTGAPWYAADVGIRAGHVVAIGRLDEATATQRIDAAGSIVAPGFIDMLGQSELTLLVNPHVPSKIFQGITTEITGEGNSVAPVNDAIAKEQAAAFEHYQIKLDWSDFSGYFARLERQGIGINMGSYVGATTMREMIVGYADRAATASELAQMQSLVGDAMREGALGVSSALEYAPAPYASTDELIALARSAAQFGGIYATHMRSEQEAILTSIDETIRIGHEAHIPVEIWHLKAGGVNNFGLMPEIVGRIERARAAGVDIAADTYAYPAWYNDLSAFIPPWAHDGGDAKLIERLQDPAIRARLRKELATVATNWDNEWQSVRGPQDILISTVLNPQLAGIQGHTLADVAKSRGTDPIDTLFDILVEDHAHTYVAVFAMSEPDIELAVVQPWVSFCNDSEGTSPDGVLGKEFPHPRAYGTFPRVLRKYVREERRMRLEEAIRKFTSLPASRLRLNDRGVLKAGMWADIVVFDPDLITDRATFAAPKQLSVGMQWVLVNGVPVIADGVATNALPGQVLRGPGYRAPAHPAVRVAKPRSAG
ncbi:MAG: N-acyl-D-amino-acid deacylase family protein [Steroidobacteraceae bacterium]|jgi:N-acyl-D-aspartate/D-glutamate deacylase